MSPRSRPRPARAFTLVETVVSLSVFTILSLGILAVIAQVRRQAEANVYENTALTLAQGYIEQLRSLSYDELLNAAQNTSAPLMLRGAHGVTLSDEAGGVLHNRDWAAEVVMLDRNDAGQEIQPMPFRFQIALSTLGGGSIGPNGIEVALTYETILPLANDRPLRRTLRTVRSVVPTY
ncbi:MAG: prepilin-type N-terminal cleavage/methylation domain-containing protein [Opitutaceae bacterium]|jgi:type II secretory pathway pseudopilin PulG|nr:prepilin-type N-terminal cleavage/methylation domain-containing protein [Opitutaceae bacterium]